MEEKKFSINHKKHPVIVMDVIPGHFTTNSVHSTHYPDVSRLKTSISTAREVARELALPYKSSSIIDTIVCLERTEVIGAFIAEELQDPGIGALNSDKEIMIISPQINANRNLVFPDNTVPYIRHKNILLLMATIVSGKQLSLALDCLDYYEGRLAGITTLFWATQRDTPKEVVALFTSDDIPGYHQSPSGDCEMCRRNIPLDALISSDGYIKMSYGFVRMEVEKAD